MTLNGQICSNEMTEAVGSGSDTPSAPVCQKPALFTVRLQFGRGDPATSIPFPSSSWTKMCMGEDGAMQELLCSP